MVPVATGISIFALRERVTLSHAIEDDKRSRHRSRKTRKKNRLATTTIRAAVSRAVNQGMVNQGMLIPGIVNPGTVNAATEFPISETEPIDECTLG